MKCPNCDTPLMMTERKGIEIDFCTQCRGIWLDRGELDKIIEISSQELQATVTGPELEPISAKSQYKPARSDRSKQYRRDEDRGPDRGYSRDERDYRDRGRPYRKQKTLLHTLLDIID